MSKICEGDAKSLVAQLAPYVVSNRDIHGSTLPTQTIDVLKKSEGDVIKIKYSLTKLVILLVLDKVVTGVGYYTRCNLISALAFSFCMYMQVYCH